MNFKSFLKSIIIFFPAIIFASGINQLSSENKQVIKFDPNADITTNLPVNFRTMQDITKLKFQENSNNLINGIEKLNASGSAQFYSEVIPSLILALRQKSAHDITIVDLREESHAFINGTPYYWYLKPIDDFIFARYNLGKNASEIEKDEIAKINELKHKKTAAVYSWFPNAEEKAGWPNVINKAAHIFKVETVMTEKELVNQHGLHYVRIPITDDHGPSIQAMDEFVKLFKEYKESWLHFHCEAGEGRTSTGLAFLDMFYNAKNIDFETIIKRQSLLGNYNLLSIAPNPLPLAQKVEKERIQSLKSFYQYCKENNDDYQTLYSIWLKNL